MEEEREGKGTEVIETESGGRKIDRQTDKQTGRNRQREDKAMKDKLFT